MLPCDEPKNYSDTVSENSMLVRSPEREGRRDSFERRHLPVLEGEENFAHEAITPGHRFRNGYRSLRFALERNCLPRPDEVEPVPDSVTGASGKTEMSRFRGWWNERKTRGFRDLGRFMPVLRWLPEYQWRDHGRGDLVGGVTLGMLILPQSMAYATLASLPPVYGLYSSLFPLLIYFCFGTSPHLSVGPVAINCLLFTSILSEVYEPGTIDYIQGALTLNLYIGILSLLCGICRVGYVVTFISPAVITGFTTANAVLIIISQLQPLFGYHVPKSDHAIVQLYRIFEQIATLKWQSLLFGISTLLLILALRKRSRRLPGAMMSTLAAMAVCALWKRIAPDQSPPVVGHVPSGLPSLSLPSLVIPNADRLITGAAIIGLLGFMQSIAAAKKYAEMYGGEVDANQELIALGLAHVGGAFFKGIDPTGAFCRSAVGVESGVRTQVASLATASIVAISLLFLTDAFQYIPDASLAAVIIAAVYPLLDFSGHAMLWRIKSRDGMVAAVTATITTIGTVPQGLAAGIVTSLLVPVARSARPGIPLLGEIPPEGSGIWRELKRYRSAVPPPKGIRCILFEAELTFANVNYLKEVVFRTAEGIFPMQEESGGVDDEGSTDVENAAIGTTTTWHNGGQFLDTFKNGTTRSDGSNVDQRAIEPGERENRMEEGSLASAIAQSVCAGRGSSQRASYIVLDLSATTDIDTAGVWGLAGIATELLASHNCSLLLVSVRNPVRDILRRAWSDRDEDRELLTRCFKNVSSAVQFAVRCLEARNRRIPERFSRNHRRSQTTPLSDLFSNRVDSERSVGNPSTSSDQCSTSRPDNFEPVARRNDDARSESIRSSSYASWYGAIENSSR